MVITELINMSALSEHRKILNVWLGIILAGLLFFAGILVLSYFVLNAPGISQGAERYQRAQQVLGISELGGLVLSALAYLRYVTVKNKYHKQVFDRFVADNGWTPHKKYGMDKIASTILGTGEDYEQGYGFDGTFDGRPFSCLIFEFIASDAKARRYICLSFTLPKAYPMIVISNKLNDHRLRHLGDPLGRMPKGVELTLEGDFSEYFRVSTSEGDEQETLEVLSPDFMAALEDHAVDRVDIEISDKKLFLVYEADYYSEQNVAAIFTAADTVLGKLDRLSKTWLASSKDEEQVIAQSADAARHHLIFRADWAAVIVFIVLLVAFLILMVSYAKTVPPCTATNPCYQLP